MTTKERLDFCTICENRKVNLKEGLICSLSKEKPNFEIKCDFFSKDKKEAERKLKQKLDAAGNAKSQYGSLDPKKNISYGIFLMVSGLLIFLFSILFGSIILFTGISFLIRGISQKKIIKENELFEEKLQKK